MPPALLNCLRFAVRWTATGERHGWSFLTKTYLCMLGVSCGRDLFSLGLPLVRRARSGRIQLGMCVRMHNLQRGNPIGLNHCCIMVAGPGAVISVAGHVGLSGVVLNAKTRIEIGQYCLLGANVRIFDHDFHPLNWEERRADPKSPGQTEPVVVCDDVFVGTGAMILKGVIVGKGAVIGAGAVITKPVPPFTIWAGNPARQVGVVSETSRGDGSTPTRQTTCAQLE